jgi:S1-C subfamily serine protease
MIRTFLAFLFIYAFASLAAAADWADVYAQRARAIALVELSNTDGDGGHCTGIVINAADGYVLTAGHCIEETAGFSYAVDRRDASVVRVNHVLDLAVLKTRLRKEATTLPLAPAVPAVGSSVAVLGYPFNARTLTMQAGIVANPDVEGFAWMNADLLPGDSGGAIVNDAGELVAVTSGTLYRGPAHIGVTVGLETLRGFVEDLLPPAPATARK